MKREELLEYLNAVVLRPKYQPKNGVTHCNEFVCETANMYGYDSFNGLLANDMIDVMNTHWEEIGEKSAFEKAMMGELVIAGRKYPEHGHVCVVYPSWPEYSLSYNRLVPMVANVGKTNGIMRLSQVFKVGEQPSFYWREM